MLMLFHELIAMKFGRQRSHENLEQPDIRIPPFREKGMSFSRVFFSSWLGFSSWLPR
jgi:hypothetical protein